MKKKIKTIAVLTVLSFMAVGCQKESLNEDYIGIQQTVSVRNVRYTIDGASHFLTVRGEQNWQEFVGWMLQMAKAGHKVSFRIENDTSCQQSTKNVVVFKTTDEKEAQDWCKTMTENGYDVTIEYDPHTGIYTCTAAN